MTVPLTIKAIDLYPVAIPLREPFKTALRTVTTAETTIIVVTDSDGMTGIGEAAPTAAITGDTQESIRAAIETAIAPKLVGQSLSTPEKVKRSIDKAIIGNHSPKAGVNIAINDLLAKHYGVPVAQYLGGYRTTFETDYTVSVGSESEMVTHAQKLVSAGFHTLKVKVGTLAPEGDLKHVAAIRAAVGDDVALRLDANQGWRPKAAARAINEMVASGLNIELVEQPVAAADFEGMAYVTQHTEVPIMADEGIFSPADALRLLNMGGCDIINLKLMKAGGLDNAIAINTLAETFGVPCMVGSMIESQISVTAAAHLVAAKQNVSFVDLDAAMMFTRQPVTGGIVNQGSLITVPDAPGLGITFEPSK